MTSNGASSPSTENLKKESFVRLTQCRCARWHHRCCGWSTDRPARSSMKRIRAKLLRALGIDWRMGNPGV